MMAYDDATQTAYFVTSVNVSSKVVKFNINDITNRTTLNLSIGQVKSLGKIANGYLIGTQTNESPNMLVRINIGTFTEAGTLTLRPISAQTTAINTDTVSGETYVSINEDSGNNLFKVNNASFTVSTAINYMRGAYSFEFDSVHNEVIINHTSRLARLDMSTLSELQKRDIRLNDNNIYDVAVTNSGSLFGITRTQLNYPELIKIHPTGMTKSDARFLDVNDFVRPGTSITYNPISDKLYVGMRDGTNTTKFAEYNPATLERTREMSFGNFSQEIGRGYISQDGLTGYFPVGADLQKVDLTAFTSLGSLAVPHGATGVLVADETNAIGYVVSTDVNHSGQAAIFKFDLNTMTYLGQLLLPEAVSESSLAIDTTNHHLYVGTTGTPSKVLSIDTGTFTLGSSLTLTADDGAVHHIITVPQKGIGFVSTSHTSGANVTAFSLSTMTSTTNYLNNEGYAPNALTYNAANSILYLATDKDPARINKIEISTPSLLYATKVTLTAPTATITRLRAYSHAAGGNMMLGVYDTAKNLLWQSTSAPNTITNGLIDFAISSGTPTSLTLTAGDYYLVLQVQNADGVASYKTVTGNGLKMSNTYGTFPSSLSGALLTDESFSIGALYNSSLAISPASNTITEGGAADTFSIALSDAPTDDVTLALATADGVIATPTPLTFTSANWNTPQIVSLSIPNNNTAEANRTSNVTFTLTSADALYNGLSVPAHSVSILDAGAPSTPPTPAPTYSGGGGGSSSSSSNSQNPNTNTTPNTNNTNAHNDNSTPSTPNSNTPSNSQQDLTPNTTIITNPVTGNSVDLSNTSYYQTTSAGQPVITYPDAPKMSIASIIPSYVPYEASLCPTLTRQVYLSDIKDVSNPILQEYTMNLVKKGVAFDVANNEIDPNQKVLRSDVLKYSMQSSCDKYPQYIIDKKPFSDVSLSHKNVLYVSLAKLRNIVSGYENDYKFRPDKYITRAEALKIVIETVLGDGKRIFDGTAEPFVDISWKDDTVWFRNYVRFAYEKGIITVPQDKEFRPYDEVNKSEIIYMLSRALAVKNM